MTSWNLINQPFEDRTGKKKKYASVADALPTGSWSPCTYDLGGSWSVDGEGKGRRVLIDIIFLYLPLHFVLLSLNYWLTHTPNRLLSCKQRSVTTYCLSRWLYLQVGRRRGEHPAKKGRGRWLGLTKVPTPPHACPASPASSRSWHEPHSSLLRGIKLLAPHCSHKSVL